MAATTPAFVGASPCSRCGAHQLLATGLARWRNAPSPAGAASKYTASSPAGAATCKFIKASPRGAAQRGFTLIEVLVAISVMALMSLMAWRGLDGMLRTQSSLKERADNIRTLQAGLAQWQADHDQLAELPGTPSWDWDGQVLRLTRRSAMGPASLNGGASSSGPGPVGVDNGAAWAATRPASVQVVAWTWRSDPGRPGGGDWQRWQSGLLQRVGDWQNAWALAQQWGQTPDAITRAGQVQIHPLSGWQIFVHRGGSWANPLSSDAVTVNPSGGNNATGLGNNTQNTKTPDGVRLVLTLPPGPVGTGLLTLDWVRPTLSGPPS